MIQQTAKIEYNRMNVLAPNFALINTSMQEVRYIKSFANTPANRAVWALNLQVVYLDSTPEILAQVEIDKNKPAIIYSALDTVFSADEIIQLIDICTDNEIEYTGDDETDLTNLSAAGVAIIRTF